jgi:molecular chaperone HscB
MADAFDILGLAPAFEIDAAALRRAFLSRSAELHPDSGGTGDGGELDAIARLNQAKALLANPERRAELLLGRLGGPGKEQDRSLPEGFLADIMETREAIEAAATEEDRRRWRAWAQEQRRQFTARAAGLFAHAGSVSAQERPGVLGHLRRELNAWRYIERLIEQLEGDAID